MKNRIYTIQVLDDNDYDALDEQFSNIKKEDLKNSLGFADIKKGEAYVRKTNVALLDETTMQHELQELLSKTSEHEIDGIRWKKGSAIAKIIAPIAIGLLTGGTGFALAPWLGSTATGALLGGATSAGLAGGKPANWLTQGALGALGAGGSAAMGAGAAAGGKAAAPGFLSKAKGILGGALGMTPATTPTATTPTGLGGQFAAQQAAEFGTPVTFGGQTSLLTGGAKGLSAVTPSILGSVMPSIGQPSPAGVGTAQQVTQQAPTTQPTLMGKIGETLKQPSTILGGASVLGSMATPTPKFEMPSQIADLQKKLMEGGSLTPLGEQAKTELASILKSTPTELYPTATDEYYNAALRRTRESYAEAEKQLDAAYNLAGVYGSGEHMAEKAKLKEQLARTESGLAAETEQRRFELATTAKYQALQDSLGVDKDTMDDIAGLTGLSVEVAAMLYGAQVQDIQQIREALGTLGMELIMKGIPQAGMGGTAQK